MICHACKIDFEDSYREVDDKNSKRKFAGQRDHYGMPFRVFGLTCPNCGEVLEYITIPTGNLYFQNRQHVSPKLLYGAFLYLQELIELDNRDEFRKFTEPLREALRKEKESNKDVVIDDRQFNLFASSEVE